jgi:WhiB family transcriptional regulator, redox-sensing transcriptional regulator
VTPEEFQRARCRGRLDIDFFPGPGEVAATRVAKAVCEGCPVKGPCARLAADESWGIWGGMDARERAVARRAQRLSRQPKADAVRAYVNRHRNETFGVMTTSNATGVTRQTTHETLRRMEMEGLLVRIDSGERGKRWRWKG